MFIYPRTHVWPLSFTLAERECHSDKAEDDPRVNYVSMIPKSSFASWPPALPEDGQSHYTVMQCILNDRHGTSLLSIVLEPQGTAAFGISMASYGSLHMFETLHNLWYFLSGKLPVCKPEGISQYPPVSNGQDQTLYVFKMFLGFKCGLLRVTMKLAQKWSK